MSNSILRFSVWCLAAFATAAVCDGADFRSCLARPLQCGGGLRCCPDDYRGKPAPCPPCVAKGLCCDDYCPKPLPCVPCVRPCTTCDDYCGKPMPCISRAPRQFLKCPSPECCGGGASVSCGG